MKKLFILTLGLVFVSFAYGQNPYEDYKFETAEDCREFAPVVRDAADWLIQTPIDDDIYNEQNRLYTVKFILDWMRATKDVTFDAPKWFEEMSGKNLEVSAIIFASMAKYAIDHNYDIDTALMYETAIKDSVKYYNDNIKYLKKNKKIAKYQKLIDEDRLSEVI